MDEIRMHTGMSDREIKEDMTDKENILRWLVNNRINTVNTVGKIIADYYRNSQEVLEIVRKKKKPKDVFEKKLLAELKRSS
jgi:predicted GNAT superfamily acetyltransferase